MVALAHAILVIIYQILTAREPYRKLGGTYFDEREHQQIEQRLVYRLERLGYQIPLQITAPAQIAIA